MSTHIPQYKKQTQAPTKPAFSQSELARDRPPADPDFTLNSSARRLVTLKLRQFCFRRAVPFSNPGEACAAAFTVPMFCFLFQELYQIQFDPAGSCLKHRGIQRAVTCRMLVSWKTVAAVLMLTSLGSCGFSAVSRRDRHLTRGKIYLEKQDYSRAILEFENAMAAMPKDAEPYYEIGLASEGKGDMVAAVGAFRKVLQLNPKHPGAQLRIAELMAGARNQRILRGAQDRLKILMESSSVTPEMLNTLALTELKLGKTDDAVKSLEQALENAPKELSSSIMLAKARVLQNNLKGAEEALQKACDAAPNAAEPRVVLARFYRSQNRLAEAEVEYQRALTVNPNSTLALLDLAILQNSTGRAGEAEANFKHLSTLSDKTYGPFYALFLFQTGRRNEAVREFQRLANQDPDDRQARARLVSAYRAVNRTADAEKVLETALERNPKDSDAHLQRGATFLIDGKYAQAEADLNQALHLRPEWAEAHYLLAKLNQARGSNLIYRQELSEALRFNPYLLSARLELVQDLLAHKGAAAALDTINATPDGQKQLTAVLVQRNWIYWTLRDLAEMRRGIDQGLSRDKTPDLFVQDGLWKLRSGNAQGARASLEQALKINPGDVLALKVLSASYMARQQDAVALQKVKEYAKTQPHSAPVQEFLGTLLMVNGDRQQARAAFEAAKAADPRSDSASRLLIQADIADGRLDDAQKRLEAALSSNQKDVIAHLWLGNLQVMKRNSTAAIEQFRQVLIGDPNNAPALNNLAYLLIQSGGDSTEALKDAQKAKELAPDDAAYSDTLGWVLYREGLYPSAIGELERAASKMDDPVVKYHLAMAYAKAGRLQLGRATFEAARKQNPRLPEAKVALQLFAGAGTR